MRASSLVVVDSNLLFLPGETLLLWGGFSLFEKTPSTIFGSDVLCSYLFERQEETYVNSFPLKQFKWNSKSCIYGTKLISCKFM